jgi:hypothetical protein
MAFLVSAIASTLTEAYADESEERTSPLIMVAASESVLLVGWLILIAIG